MKIWINNRNKDNISENIGIQLSSLPKYKCKVKI